MKFSHRAVAALAFVGNASCFSIQGHSTLMAGPTFTRNTAGRTAPHSTSLYFSEISGGMEELHELAEEDAKNILTRRVRKSPSFWKLAGYATIPISAALGFGLVPSRRLAAHAAGALVTGVAGAVGKSRLDAITESAATPAIAQALLDHKLEDAVSTASYVKQIQSDFGIVDNGDFEAMCGDVYSKYLLGMVKYNPQAKTSELKELDNLKIALGLSNLQVGEAHASAAEEWYRTTCQFTPEEDLEDPDHPDRVAMHKMLFLTERALRQGEETEEAFRFEMTRVAKAMHVSLPTAMERVAEVVEPFYERALKSTRSKLGSDQVSSGMLQRARNTLGISDQTAFDMHVATFNEEVRSLLGIEENGEETKAGESKFKDGAEDRLSQLRAILELSESDASYEIAAEVTPLFQSTALASTKAVLAGTKTPDASWELIDARRRDLLLGESETRGLISSIVMQALGAPLEEASKFAKVNNEAAVYDNILEALEAKEGLLALLAKSGINDFEDFDKTFCDPWNRESANGFLRPDERIKLYRTFLTRSVRKAEDGRLSDETNSLVQEVKGLLGISDDQAEIEARLAFGPELQKKCLRAMTEIIADCTPELVVNMQNEIEEVMTSYRLSSTYLQEQGASCYTKAVAQISGKSPAGIPTPEMSEALDALRKLYHLDVVDTYASHMEYFGTVYRKSVLEAMGATGIIRPEFREALNNLRDRLGLRESDTKKIFLDAVEERMVPMVKWVVSEMERTMLTQEQQSQRRKKDMGQDVFQSGKGADGVLGLGAEVNMMSDIMNLVDFYGENNIAEEAVVTKQVDGKEEPFTQTVYPVNALAAGATDQETAEYLYRQFVVGAFSAQGTQGPRYEGARSTFGGILGLTPEKMEEINSTIGGTVYDNFVSRNMASKGTLDQQDMMFLANIQGKLGLSSEQGEKMLLQSQKKVLSEEINSLMDNPSPAGLKAFREKCNTMGMDLAEDVGISSQRLVRMFEAEVTPALKAGEISADESELLTEIQESLNLDPEECESMLENIISKLSKQAVDLTVGELMRGRDENTVDLIKEIVRYAAFTEGELRVSVEESMANQIFNIYEKFDFANEDKEVIESNKEVLQLALGLSR